MERMVNEKIDNEGKRHPFESKISHNPKNDLIQPVSFFGMFRYATQRDKFLMFIGIVSSAITGILQPLSIILFGRVAGDSIDYAQSLMNDNLTPAEKLEAENIFLDGVKFFATWNSLIGIGMLFFCYIATVTFNYSAMEQTFRIRSKYLKSILNQDISWYDQNQTGDFASRMSDDLYKFEDGIGEKVPIFLQYQVLLVTAVVVAFIKGWQLALVSVISIPASVISFSFINVLTTRLAKNEMEAYGASASIADEVFSLIRTVTAFGGQDKETKRYQKNLMFARKNNIRRSSLFGIGLGLMYLLLYSSYALTFWYGVKLVLRDRGDPNATYTPENMLTIFFNIMSASLNFGSASSFIEIFGIAKAAAAKIFTVIENEPDINLSKGKGEKLESLKGIIKFKDVKFHYPSRPDVPILQGLNLEIKSGDTVALVGSSGCGKSTVIQLIQRFYNAISGEVEDKEINDFKKSKVSLIQIIKLNAPEWPYILVAGIAATVVGCGLPAFSVLYGSILGTLANSDSNIIQSKTNNYCLYIVGAGVICLITAYFQLYLLGIAGEKMTERIRAQMFKAIISQDMEFFDKKSNGVGSLCARLSGDPAQVQGATGQRVGQILQSLATLVVAIGLSLYYEWKLALVTAAFLPVMALALFVERRNTAGINDTRDQSLEKSTKIAVEAIGNIRTVASLVAEDMFHRNYINELTPHYKLSLRSLHSRGIIFGMSRSISFFAYAASLYYGGFLIIDGLYYDRVFKVAQIQLMGIVSVANSFAFSPNLMKGINAARRIITFMSKIPQIRDGPNSIEIKDVKGDIKFSSVNFSYPTRSKTQILRGLDLNILNGKTVALVGESGCGKSTIIQLIERFYDPTSGNVQLDDFDIKSFTLSSLRSHLGIVSQEPNLFNKTIGENIAYGDNSRVVPMDEIIHAAKCANIHNFVSSLPKGYDTKLGEKAVQLSGGQKQRIAIARALVRNPKILLLDEATSALDTESEKIVQEALDGAKKGRTCITIAHRLTTIQDADLICVVDNGAIVESGTHKELLNINGIYHKLYTHNR
ncbi:ATP-dependent translocase ABCB1-like isoform X5 [Diorhabda carinulata]|uniref:ATP-dependent translocase ABCB1-like isoform X5 n=1 Tax=Diorhabda carinulata TaxID=1163345 RepID=UPI0025A29F42|nr:ATP-dependent translocase ABCB1-like isoform X5 [Diorhabda carinulata]